MKKRLLLLVFILSTSIISAQLYLNE